MDFYNVFYHVFNKSISGIKIFNEKSDFERFKNAMFFYAYEKNLMLSFKMYRSKKHTTNLSSLSSKKIIHIISYCLMPNHFHILLSSQNTHSVSKYLNNLLNSYTRYFNIKYERKGPLWQSRTKKTLIDHNAYFIHLTRYIHLNPVTSYLVEKPQDWEYSSYKEYIQSQENVCNYKIYFEENYDFKNSYKKFVEDRKDYQRSLKDLEYLIIE